MWSALIFTALLCHTTAQTIKVSPTNPIVWLFPLLHCCFSPNSCYNQGCRGWNRSGQPVLLLNHLLKHQILRPGGCVPSDYLCKSIKPQSNWLDTSPPFQDLVFLEAVKVSVFVPASLRIPLSQLTGQLTWVESIEEGLDLCFGVSLQVKE